MTPAVTGSEVEPRGPLDSAGGHGMDVAFAKDQVVLAAHFDLVPVFGAEQHPIALLDGPDVLTLAHDLGPHETFRHLCGGRDQDPTGRSALALIARDPNEQAIVHHLDRELLVRAGHGDGRYQRGRTMTPAPARRAFASPM